MEHVFTVRFAHPVLTQPQVDLIRAILSPELRISIGQGALFDGKAAGVDDPMTVTDLVRVLDLQQEQLARSFGEGHRVIHGVAGSGKTMILGFRCLHLAKTLGKPILVHAITSHSRPSWRR
jgi:hypothetical protein